MLTTVFKSRPCLFDGFQAGDQRALAAVYVHYVPIVRQHLRRQVQYRRVWTLIQPCSMDELVQDVFAAAFSGAVRKGYDPTRPFEPYLRAIATNTLIDRVRARLREDGALKHVVRDDMVDAAPQETERELIKLVRTHVEQLPLPLKRVYVERFVFDNSQVVAAQNLNLSRKQVRLLESQLRKQLKRALVSSGWVSAA